MTKMQHKFFCWTRVIKRPEITMELSGKPPKKSSKTNTPAGMKDEWSAVEGRYNEPTGSVYVTDFDGEAFATEADAEFWAKNKGKKWIADGLCCTLMSFDIAVD